MVRSINRVVEPEVPCPDGALRAAIRILTGGGFAAADAGWLAPWLLRTLPTCGTAAQELASTTELHLTLLAMAWGFGAHTADEHTARHRACLMLLAILTGAVETPEIQQEDGGAPFHVDEQQAKAFVQMAQEHGIDWNIAVRSGWPDHLAASWKHAGARRSPSGDAGPRAFFRLLLVTGAIDFGQVLDVDRLRRGERCSGWSLSNEGCSWADGTDWFDPRVLEVWLFHVGIGCLWRMLALAQKEDHTSLPVFVTTVARAAAARFANSEYGLRLEFYGGLTAELKPVMQQFGRELRPFFELLDERVGADPDMASPELRAAWVLLFRMAWDADRPDCPPPLRQRMVEAGKSALHRVRRLLEWSSDAQREQNTAAFRAQLPFLRQCCSLVAFHGSLWEMINPLLLALRKLPVPAVARDLRDWEEFADDPVPTPWGEIPSMLKTYLHAATSEEQARDENLDALRAEFTHYCLDRLAPSKAARRSGNAANATASAPKEPLTVWRYCLVRAAGELRRNRHGEAHRMLHQIVGHDPDDGVRRAAKSCESWLQHCGQLPRHVHPRRLVLRALWWLKQAHAITTFGPEVTLDPHAVGRTLRKEIELAKHLERSEAQRLGLPLPNDVEEEPRMPDTSEGGAA